MENIEKDNKVEFVTAKITKEMNETLTASNKKSKIPKQWILDEILRNYFKSEEKEE